MNILFTMLLLLICSSQAAFAQLISNMKCDNENITSAGAGPLSTDSSGNLYFGPYAGVGNGGLNVLSLGMGYRPNTVPPNSVMLWIENHEPCDPRIQIRSSNSPGVLELGNETLASETNLYLTVLDHFKLEIGDGDHIDGSGNNPGHIMATFDPLLNIETVMGSIVVTADVNNKGGAITNRDYRSTSDMWFTAPGPVHFGSNDVYSLALTPSQGNVSFYGNLTGFDSATGKVPSISINQAGSIQIQQAITILPNCVPQSVGTEILYANGKGSISLCVCEQINSSNVWSPVSTAGSCQ